MPKKSQRERDEGKEAEQLVEAVYDVIENISKEMEYRRKFTGRQKHGLKFLRISLSELEQEAVCELVDYLNWSMLEVAKVLVTRRMFQATLENLQKGV